MYFQTDQDDEVMPPVDGEQHFGGEKKFPVFRWGRCKPACNGVKNCRFPKTEDGTAVNIQEVIDEKFAELNEAKNQRYIMRK